MSGATDPIKQAVNELGLSNASSVVTAILYVSPLGNNTTGLGWDNAFTTLQMVGYSFEPSVAQKHKIRFTADDGATYFDEVIVEAKKNSAVDAGAGTEYIFNVGTQIKASCKAETGGEDTVQVWLKIQNI